MIRLVSLCLIVSAAVVLAQSDRGTVTGTIADPAGAVVANAPLEAKNTETGAVFQAATSDTGNYTLPQLPAGVYEISVTVPGFKKFVRQNVTVGVAQTVRVDIALEVGSAAESVTVTEQTSLLKTESGELSHTVQAQRLIDLGLLGIGGTFSSSQGLRFYMTEIQLIPGASAPGTGFIFGARVNGAPNGTQRTQIDGMDGTNQINSVQAGTTASVDAIQESAIQTSNYAAEFGQVGGGLFNITMRSGTNQYHGGGYDYLMNEAFNASTPYVNKLPRIRRNDYGFSLGGPVWIPGVYRGKDKTFFYYNREQYREFFVVNDTAITVPTANYRAGNFTQALTGRNLGTDPLGRTIADGMIFDPLTVRTVNGVPVRDQFPGNTILPARFDRVSAAIQALIPNPTDPGRLTGNYLPSFPNDRVTTNESVKLDHQFTSKFKVSGTWLTNATSTQFSQSLNQSEGLPATITQTRGSFSRSMNWRLNLDYTISPTMLWHAGIGSLQYLLDDHSPTRDFDQVKSLGLVGTPNPGGRFPSLSGLTNATTGGMANMGPGVGAAQSLTKQFTPTYQTSLTWVKGNHTYKFGGELRTFGYPLHSLTATNGSFVFAANQTAQLSNCATPASCSAQQSSTLGVGTLGFPYASFLLGLVNNGVVNPPVDLKTGKRFLAFYAQDSWKITRRLTLDYGLRYDYDTYPREQYGRMPTASLSVPNPTAGGRPGGILYESTCNCNFAKNYPYAFGPRLGVAYQITPRTVFRAGVAVAYDGTATAATGTASASANNAFQASGFGESAMKFDTGVPAGYVLSWPNRSAGAYPNPNFPANRNGPTSIVDQNAGRPARQIQWSVGLQREITRNTVVEASYVANRGAWWLSGSLNNYNAVTPQALAAVGLDINSAADRAILRAPIGSSAAGRFQNKLPYAGFPTTASVAESLRPFPQFTSGLAPLWAPQGRTWYDSLQMKVTQRVWHGLEAQYAFTWAKELQMGTEGGTVNDVFNRSQNKTISGFSRPLVSVLSIHYRVPAPPGNKIVSLVLRDWALGTTLNYASGLPILAPTSTNNLNTLLFRSTFYNRVEGVPLFLKDLNCHCIDPTKDLVLNPAAWSNPADGQFGTAAPYYNDYRYERRPSESLSVGRIFQFGTDAHPMKLTVRMNFTNAFNRIQMSNPAGAPSSPTVKSSAGLLTGGFGFINYQGGSTFLPSRQGTLEMRFSF